MLIILNRNDEIFCSKCCSKKFGISPSSEAGFALLPSRKWVSPVCHYQTVSHRWNASVCSSAIASVCSVSSLDGTPTLTRLRPRRCPRLPARPGFLAAGAGSASDSLDGTTSTGASPAAARSRRLPRRVARPRQARLRRWRAQGGSRGGRRDLDGRGAEAGKGRRWTGGAGA